MTARIALAALLVLAALLRSVAESHAAPGIESDARRLLSRAVRASGVDPSRIVFSHVAATGEVAAVSWDAGTEQGVLGMLRRDDRWWDALDVRPGAQCWSVQTAYPLESAGDRAALLRTAGLANASMCDADAPPPLSSMPIRQTGGVIHQPARTLTSGYDFTLHYAPNDAGGQTSLTRLYVRPPTQAEFAPAVAPAAGWGASNAVCFFEIEIDGPKPVTFEPGTVLDVWFPFVLDDQLRYDVNYVSGTHASDMIGGSIFDNTLHFVLPGFTLHPGDALMGEIDGNPPR